MKPNTPSQPPSRIAFRVPQRTKQEVFDSLIEATRRIEIDLQSFSESDFAELPEYIASGSIENGDQVRNRHYRGGGFKDAWQFLALIALGRYFQTTHDIAWHEVKWINHN